MITTEDLLKARFTEFEPDLVQEILAAGQIREFAHGDYLLKAGQIMTSTILVLDGRVKIYREDDSGSEYLVYYLESGNACAYSIMCALSGLKSQISAVADSDTTALTIPFEFVRKWMGKYPGWDQFVIRNYRNRFEETLSTIDHIAFQSLDKRLVYYLKDRTEREGAVLSISHQEIARDLNSAREVVSRLLKKLEKKGAVKLGRNIVEVINLEELS